MQDKYINLVDAKGARWKRLRTIAAPHFSARSMKEVLLTLNVYPFKRSCSEREAVRETAPVHLTSPSKTFGVQLNLTMHVEWNVHYNSRCLLWLMMSWLKERCVSREPFDVHGWVVKIICVTHREPAGAHSAWPYRSPCNDVTRRCKILLNIFWAKSGLFSMGLHVVGSSILSNIVGYVLNIFFFCLSFQGFPKIHPGRYNVNSLWHWHGHCSQRGLRLAAESSVSVQWLWAIETIAEKFNPFSWVRSHGSCQPWHQKKRLTCGCAQGMNLCFPSVDKFFTVFRLSRSCFLEIIASLDWSCTALCVLKNKENFVP